MDNTEEMIRDFLSGEKILSRLLDNCDVRQVAPSLLAKKAISRGQFDALGPSVDVSSANSAFFSFLFGDPSVEKLEKVVECFQKDKYHHNNCKLARDIEGFLKSQSWIGKNQLTYTKFRCVYISYLYCLKLLLHR